MQFSFTYYASVSPIDWVNDPASQRSLNDQVYFTRQPQTAEE